MEIEKATEKLTLEELKELVQSIIRHSSVILIQRDPKDKKMDERSALVHRLWLRLSEKVHSSAGAYPNIKEHPTHEQVLTIKLKQLLDKSLDTPLSDEAFSTFLSSLIQKALGKPPNSEG